MRIGEKMEFVAKQLIGSYEVERVQSLVECAGEARIFVHRKTGARVLHIANDDDNTVFCVALRTPPENNTGLPHILEHSVLCGSEKFPPKKPFVHMLKTSLQTFLNAMTFADKTIYPVASRNPQDFRNLVSVYLDAVFFPRLTRETFLQEGWHLHAENANDSFDYKGVVYNEMRGVYSSPESVLSQRIQTVLLKGTPYEFDSGGDPSAIPSLTYEQFCDFHKRYYHPSNSWTVLYGKLDVVDYLAFIDERVFSRFERSDAKSEISPLKPQNKIPKLHEKYSLGESDSPENKTYLGKAWFVGDVTDAQMAYGLEILYSVLLGTDASPLREALVSSGLGQDSYSYFSNDARDGILFAGVSGSNPEKEKAVQDLIEKTLCDILKSGFAPLLIESVLTRMEFRLREADFGSYPKGLIYAIESYSTWIYGKDPLVRVAWENVFSSVKKEVLENRLLERLLEHWLLNNSHAVEVVFEPSVGLSAHADSVHQQVMQKKKEAMGDAEVAKTVQLTQELIAYQENADSAQDLATLPALELSAVCKEAERIVSEKRSVESTDVHFVRSNVSGIGYLQLGFDATVVPLADAPWLSLLTSIFTSLGTQKYSHIELSQQLGIRAGGTGSSISPMGKANTQGVVNPVFAVGTKFLASKAAVALELLGELCSEQDFSNVARMRDLISAEMALVTGIVQERGARLAMLRGFASVSPRGRYAEHLEGVHYVRFVQELVNGGEIAVEKALAELKRVAKLVLRKSGLRVVSFAGGDSDWDAFEPAFKTFLNALSKESEAKEHLFLEMSSKNSALVVPSQVQYVGLAGMMGSTLREKGLIDFLNHVLRSGFLWDEVRVKGGAYGCMVGYIPEISELALVSYRDPNLKKTLDVYKSIPKYLEQFPLSQTELDELKIGYFGGIDKPLTLQQKNRTVWRDALVGVSHEDSQAMRDAVFGATVADVKELKSLFDKFVANGSIAVVGGAAMVRKERDMFEVVDEVTL